MWQCETLTVGNMVFTSQRERLKWTLRYWRAGLEVLAEEAKWDALNSPALNEMPMLSGTNMV
ncbi:hypothetical protein ACG7TL_006785 [Trametes sanguinea]